jgi:hypothetical protein
MNLATAMLAQNSITAAQLWHQLESAESSEEIDQLLQSLWQTQETQELAVDAKAPLSKEAQQKQAQMKEVVQQNVEQTNRESQNSMELGADSEGQDVTQNIMRNISQQSAIAAKQAALSAENQSALVMQGQQAQIDRSFANILNAQQTEELNEINTAQRRQDAAAATASSTQTGLFQMPGGITLGASED